MAARRYARFLPHEKAATAARILAEVWEAHDESVAAAEMLLYRTHLFANADLR